MLGKTRRPLAVGTRLRAAGVVSTSSRRADSTSSSRVCASATSAGHAVTTAIHESASTNARQAVVTRRSCQIDADGSNAGPHPGRFGYHDAADHHPRGETAMQIAALVFDAITPLDIVGPIEVLARVPGIDIVIVGKTRGPVRDPRTHFTLTAEASLDEVSRPEVLVLPGGAGVRPLCVDDATLDWVRRIHAATTWTTSVCTGSLLLGAAGLLKGLV